MLPNAPSPLPGKTTVDAVQDATLLDNVRLWDLRAYNATITQIQALRPYYTFPDTDVDRYFINGRIKQVLLSPREIDVNQLSAEAQPELDQSAVHLYARLWRGRIRGQQDYARWPARPADRKRPSGNQVSRVSSSRGRKSTTAKAPRIRSLFTPPARSSIILPATRTSIRPTRARAAFPLALFC